MSRVAARLRILLRGRMRPFETLTLVYFAALACAAPLSRAPRDRVLQFELKAAVVCIGVLAAAAFASNGVREWLGHAYLVSAYWLPAGLVQPGVAHPTALERWLARTDAAWRRHASPLPRPAAMLLELAYLLCYPAVPFAFCVAWLFGTGMDVNRFWMSVLGAGFLSYGWLPWLVSRPPRIVHAPAASRHIASFNVAVLRRVSHELNTFPSGHVAVAVAAALSTLPVWPPGGLVVSFVAAGVVAGAVAGRYHYLTDVVLGLVTGVACGWLSGFTRG